MTFLTWLIKGAGRALLNVLIVLWWAAIIATLFIPFAGPFIAGGMALTFFLVRAVVRGFFP